MKRRLPAALLAVALLGIVLVVAYGQTDEATNPVPGDSAGSAASVAGAEARATVDTTDVDYAAAAESLFVGNCAMCHGATRPAAHLDLASEGVAARLVGVKSSQSEAFMFVESGRPERSYVIMKVTGADGVKGSRMPPAKPLEPDGVSLLEAWVVSLAPPDTAAQVAPPVEKPAE